MEIGTEAPIFLFWEYLFRNFGILYLQCGVEHYVIVPSTADLSVSYPHHMSDSALTSKEAIVRPPSSSLFSPSLWTFRLEAWSFWLYAQLFSAYLEIFLPEELETPQIADSVGHSGLLIGKCPMKLRRKSN